MKAVVYLNGPEFVLNQETLSEVHEQIIQVSETDGFVVVEKEREKISYRKDLVLKVHCSEERDE